jgi:P-type Ca2+ transporter type 2C
MRTLSEILADDPSIRDTGLSRTQVDASLQRYGANRLTPLPKDSLWKAFLAKFDEAIIQILLAATLLKTVVDLFETKGPWGPIGLGLLAIPVVALLAFKRRDLLPTAMFAAAIGLVGLSFLSGHPSFEGLAVMIAVVLATGVAFLSEYKSDREFEVLNARKDSIAIKTVRDGQVQSLPMEEIVVGDLVVLEMGDEIPADGRLVRATELLIDQSLMTGESEPVKKMTRPVDDPAEGPEHPGCLYRGTQVVDGAGGMIVTEVGDFTMLGQIARRLSSHSDERPDGRDDGAAETSEERIQRKLSVSKQETPLQLKLTVLAKTISKVGYLAAILIFVALLIRGTIIGQISFQAEHLRETIGHLLSYFVYMVIIIVVAVPEGLPMSVTVSLALAMRKMTRANSLVRQLVACETIGSATVICSDKTGTLTQNKMQVDRVGYGGTVVSRGVDWPMPKDGGTGPLDRIALNGLVNSTANLEVKEGKSIVVGNSTEGSLLLWAREAGIDYRQARKSYALLDLLHFSSDRKRMTSVVDGESGVWVLMKGAPEIVLEHCTTILDTDGTIRPLTVADRATILKQLSEAAGAAMRTLAFAQKSLPAETSREEDALRQMRETIEREMTFVGFVAIRDPLRPEVPAAIEECRLAGIEVKMITGDNIETARAIAAEVGLMSAPGSIAMTSAEFNELSDDALKQQLPHLRVLARARPLDKYRMVRLLQEQNHVVAVTGDGTNDAPALKKADVGLAMGIAGTEVAKEASKIVLLDDSFATIVKAVHWGRSLYENIQRFILFQLTINVSALIIAFLGPFLGVKPPFTVLQLLWINVIMDTFAAIALCSEPPRAGLMRLKPKRRDERIVTPAMMTTILSTAGFFVVAMLTLLAGMEFGGWFASGGGPDPAGWDFAPLSVRQVTIFFTVYVMFQFWNQINCRSLDPAIGGFPGLFRNRTFLTIALAILLGQIAIVTFGGSVFSVEPLGVTDWLAIAGATTTVLLFAEIVRRFRR